MMALFYFTFVGMMYSSQSRGLEAEEALTKAIELQPSFSAYWMRGTNYYFYLKDYPKAIADFTKAIEFQPDLDLGYSSRWLAYKL
ncbi:MAG: tetratricopeptide repeat protein [Hydrococcus sp. RM1_1_31]|nr:tetratricopeptide repeat protein [Hydrococcus sp. RM1_1_31]